MEADTVAGRWVRQGYFLEDGMLRPIPGSTAETYDLLARARQVELDRNDSVPLYLKLVEAKTPELRERFAREWGLLGLLPHEVLFTQHMVGSGSNAVLPVDASSAKFEITEVPGLGPFAPRSLAQMSSMVIQGGQPAQSSPIGPAPPPPFLGIESHLGALVHVGILDLGIKPTVLPLEARYQYFFPGLRGDEAQPYPALLSDDFWDHYSEPIEYWDHAIIAINEVLGILKRDRENDRRLTDFWRLCRTFERHLLHVQPRLAWKPTGGVEFSFSFPSLLSLLFFLMLEDITHSRLRCCPCGRWFTSQREARDYCSERCRDRLKKRRKRNPVTGEQKGIES